MQVRRGRSQILFGYLPGQTVDLSGGIFRVKWWPKAHWIREVDEETVRGALLRQIRPWSDAGRDSGLSTDLWKKTRVRVVRVSPQEGVLVERFPEVFRCTVCSRLERSSASTCKCGARSWVQWHFVSYHDCGYIGPPRFKRCPEHDQVRVTLPGTARAADLRFSCPICSKELHRSFLSVKCDCGGEQPMRHDVHRASGVYSAPTVTIVNPPDPDEAATLRQPAVRAQKLEWVLNDMSEAGGTATRESIFQALVLAGLSEADAAAQADKMFNPKDADTAGGAPSLSPEAREAAEAAAVELWNATRGERLSFSSLADVGRLPASYEPARKAAGLRSVELLTDFPVLTARFGYTRTDSEPGGATLRRFSSRNDEVLVHGQLVNTEGLLFRLDPVLVAKWLENRGLIATAPSDRRDAHELVLSLGPLPDAFSEKDERAASALLELIHTYSHRVVRQIASRVGIDREAIAEHLIPEHLAFVLFASGRGEFVLGGMQALYERDLDAALNATVHADLRCQLDPGCRSSGGACVACLHLGEPSCRHFNRFLDRRALGPASSGYFALAKESL